MHCSKSHRINYRSILVLCLWTSFSSCRTAVPPPVYDQFWGMCDYETGDLIFVCDTTGMGRAIHSSTAWDSLKPAYTHVAITECTDSGVYVIDATPTLGVSRRPLLDFFLSVYDTNADYGIASMAANFMVDVPYDTATLLERMHSFIGQPYDPYFLPGNGRLYCSELVYECFFDQNGHHLFPLKPMNFYASDGTLPAYWQHHFDSLGVTVPQGVLGTNPNDMSKSPVIHQFKIQ